MQKTLDTIIGENQSKPSPHYPKICSSFSHLEKHPPTESIPLNPPLPPRHCIK